MAGSASFTLIALPNLIFSERLLCLDSNKSSFKESYSISEGNLLSNLQLLKKIVKFYNFFSNKKVKFNNCFKFVKDRPGHDYCYSLEHSLSLKKKSKKKFNTLLKETVKTYL